MAKPARTRKNRSVRKLSVEQLEARRVFAGVDFHSLVYTAGGDAGAVYPKDVASDIFGNTYMTGRFTGQVDFDRSTALHPGGGDTITAIGNGDGFIAKYDSNNSLIWVRRFGDSSAAATSNDDVSGVHVQSDGSVFVTGTFGGVADFGPQSVASVGGSDAYVAKLSDNGSFLWVGTYATGFDETAKRISVDGSGRVTILGETRQNSDVFLFVRQFESDGTINWTANDLAMGADYSAVGLEQSIDGGVYLISNFNGTIDSDPTSGVAVVTGTDPGTFTKVNSLVTKLSSNGSFEWSQSYLAANGSRAVIQDTAINPEGDLIFVGRHTGSVSISGSGSEGQSLPVNTSGRTFFGKVNASGETLTLVSHDWAPIGQQKLTAVGSEFFLIGRFTGTFSVDGIKNLSSAGGQASFAFIELTDSFVPSSAFASSAAYFLSDVSSNLEGSILISGFVDGPVADYDPNPNTRFAIVNPATNTTGASQGVIVKLRQRIGGATVKLLDGDFEYGITDEAWTQDSQNDWFRSTQRATSGSYSAEVDGSATNAMLTTANGIDLTGLDSAQLTFDWLIESGFDSGEFLSLDVSTNGGATWIQDVRRLNGNVSPENVWRTETVDMTPYMTANTKIRFRSTVSASDEDANVDNVLINGIVSGPNASPIANAGGGYVMNEGSSILLNAAASSDPDGSIVSYAWDLDLDGQYDDATGVSPSFSTTNSGSFTIGLLVTDNRGATSTATTTVVVNNVAPTANAGNDLTGSVNQAISLSASASSDPGNDIVSYLWDLNNDGIFGDATGSQATFTSAIAGVFSVGLQVTDADGAIGHDTLTITVNAAPVLSTKFYVVDDAGSDRTYEYTSNGTSVENYSLGSGNTAPRGAASTVAGDKVWVVDANKRVYIYDTSGALLGSWAAGSLVSNATIEGITTNGTDVWLVDARQDRVYRYTEAATRLSGSQNAASSFALNSGNRDPKDLVTDGSHIWVVNSTTTDRVFKYTVAGSLVGNWVIDTANSSPTGITLDPSGESQSLWIVDNGTDRVYEYTNARIRNSGSQSAANSFALGAGNSNPQGIADPPVAPVKHRSVAAPLLIGSWSMHPEQRPVEGSQRYAAVDRAMSSGLLEYLSVQPIQTPASRVSAAPFAAEQYSWSEYANDFEKDEWDDALSQAIDELVVGAR